jgi:GNAT superfamily N-acetyltransferase
MEPDRTDLEVEAALDAERQFVFTLGGFALELAGAALVTHEKIPVPRFNFVQELGVGPERQTAFFEHALDHYFQRALRPTFRVPTPVPSHVDAGLQRFGFRPKASPLRLLLSQESVSAPPTSDVTVRVAEHRELDLVASFWTSERERPEFRAALDVAWVHPNPHETLVPLLASLGTETVSAALVYRYRSSAGIHAVATRPSARGRGAASTIVRFARSHAIAGPVSRYSIFADSARLEHRLESLGFRPARSFVEYELPPSAELALPSPGPPAGPRWRPPREPLRSP